MREGIDLASTMKARVTLLTASMPFHVFATDALMVSDTPRKYAEDVEARAAARLKGGEQYASTKGVATSAKHVYAEHPYEAIVDVAHSSGCDLVCMAAHARKGVVGLVMGSQTAKVLSHTKVPVLVCR